MIASWIWNWLILLLRGRFDLFFCVFSFALVKDPFNDMGL
jgi:hypothetical protein